MLNMQLNNSGTDMLIKFIVLIVYFAFMIGVGMYFYKKNTSHSDYILGGRQLNVWVAALSAQASDMSGWLLLGLPGLAYLIGGVSEADLDGNWPRDWYISKLADCGQAAS